MKNQPDLITAHQCVMARAALGWTLSDLAHHSDVGRATVQRFETTGKIKPATIAKLRAALENAGMAFVDSGPHKGAVRYIG